MPSTCPRSLLFWPIALALAVALSGCGSEDNDGGDSSSPAGSEGSEHEGDPTAALKEHLDLQQAGDCEASTAFYTDEWIQNSIFGTREEAVNGCEALPEVSTKIDYEYVSEEIEGDTATVVVTGWSDVDQATYEMVLQDGEWLINDYEFQE